MNDVKLLLSDLHPDVGDLFQTARTQVELTTMVRTIVFLRKRFPGMVDLMGNPNTSEEAALPSVPLSVVTQAPGNERSHRVFLRSNVSMEKALEILARIEGLGGTVTIE